jgi:protein SCO1/2
MADVARRRLIRCSASALGVAALAALAGCERMLPAAAFKAVDITGANYALDFDLPDADGQRRRLADFKGKLVVVFFGFTHCPDVCPTTLLELAQARKLMGADGARVQSVFVTVDPERDTPALLKAYVGNFGSDNVALTGTPDEIKATAKHFKVYFAKSPGPTPESYTMDHTAGSYVFDTEGKVRLFTRYGVGAQALADDLKLLLVRS